MDEVCSLILQKARYQKVLICVDENSDTEYIENLKNCIQKDTILLMYYYNKQDVSHFFNMINNGVRVVVYDVSIEKFYKLQNENVYVLNIFLPQSKFLMPYILNKESVYGDNLIVCDTSVKDYASVICLYQSAFDWIWGLLLQGADVETEMFKNIDALINGDVDFYPALINKVQALKGYINKDYACVDEEDLPYYIYLKTYSIFNMLKSVNTGTVEYIDFYKTQTSEKAISKAYNLIIKYDIFEKLNIYSNNLIKINYAILNRLKILIKKYFKIKNIKINKIIKIIKSQAKYLNADNLLYISYIFNNI